jgi:AAA domain/Primase C terminal 2 (PriCT-2)
MSMCDIELFLLKFADYARSNAYAVFSEHGGNKSYRPGKGFISHFSIIQHLKNDPPIGLYLLEGPRTRIAAIDLDNHSGQLGDNVPLDAVLKLKHLLEQDGMKPFICRSGGGKGFHLFLLWQFGCWARDVRGYLRQIVEKAGLKVGTKGLEHGEVEVFPKQDEVVAGKYGSLIALPFARASLPLVGETLEAVELSNYVPPPIESLHSPQVPYSSSEISEKPKKESSSSLDHARLTEAMSFVPADDYDIWLKFGMALKSSYGDDGFALWDQWSSTSEKYKGKEDCFEKWGQLRPEGRITVGSIIFEAEKNGWKPKLASRELAESMPLRDFILAASELFKMDLPPREFVVEPFLSLSGLNMVYAERGIGKTWFCLSLGLAIAKGGQFLGFQIPKARTVLYIDGEMSLVELQERLKALETDPDNFYLLPSESIYRYAQPLNINKELDQHRISQALADVTALGIKQEVIFIDNLSALSAGFDENDNSALDALLRWLVSLRHENLCVILVHHAGKSGKQRGASRREDLLDTSICLKKPEADGPANGARFIVEFEKTRGKSVHSFEMQLMTDPQTGRLTWATKAAHDVKAAERVLKAIAVDKPANQNELAEMAGVHKSTISSHCTKLRLKGYLHKKNLEVTDKGKARLLELWPDLVDRFEEQKDMPF